MGRELRETTTRGDRGRETAGRDEWGQRRMGAGAADSIMAIWQQVKRRNDGEDGPIERCVLCFCQHFRSSAAKATLARLLTDCID
jgi:hypothetical protein